MATEEACSGLWRSEDMQLVSIAFERGRVKKDMLALGELGCVQMCDLNQDTQAFHKEFTSEVRRCEDLNRKLRYFKDEMTKWEPAVGWGTPRTTGSSVSLNENALEEMEADVGKVFPELQKQATNYDMLRQKWLKCYESWQVHTSVDLVDLCRNATDEGALGVLAGTVPMSKRHMMERQVYCVTKGNTTSHFNEMRHPSSFDPSMADAASLFPSDDFDRFTFLFVFTSQSIGVRLRRLAVAMDAHVVVESSLSADSREAEADRQREELADCTKMLAKARESTRDLLHQSVVPQLQTWLHTAVVHKSVAYNLNMLQLRAHSAVGVAWVPKVKLPEIKQTLGIGATRADTVLMELETPGHVMPPTYFQTNYFTETFQGIVNAYGAPRYKEINPAVFTIITFPWLFGVMYGDIGHGIIISLVALLFILYEKKLSASPLNEMVEMVFGARYLLLMMGLFATYYGFLYNDCFGMMFEYSSSSLQPLAASSSMNNTQVWAGCNQIVNGSKTHWCQVCGYESSVNYDGGAPSFGVDVQWSGAGKRLDVYNSFKMKSAIVLGIVQMMLGLVLQFMNNRYFNDWKHIYFGCIPEVIFLSCTFGYMAILIMVKWASPFQVACKVSLLETMVNFFLSPTNINATLFSGQVGLQVFFLLVAVICVFPFMLFPIPYIEWKHNQEHGQSRDDDEEEELMSAQRSIPVGSGHPEEDDLVAQLFPPKVHVFDMQEVVIKQMIHAIEFVLGSVSNTASYLRLWALSLAHAQLSEVFLEFLIMAPLEQTSLAVPMWFVGFSAWLSATLFILIGMEALSAFLHALRLHWVEFQNKFYIADGTLFQPLDLAALRKEADVDIAA
eukprot:TRINITY_DN933_c0_g1_i1.p2 TRINITY_DN933_c0_g1~~TRINITY_DN933_c0_g1_i1.p2  ORF type:complete len:862 (+),score=407.37 TRINITY_DN933_c0_g1_i1:58-2586(+)